MPLFDLKTDACTTLRTYRYLTLGGGLGGCKDRLLGALEACAAVAVSIWIDQMQSADIPTSNWTDHTHSELHLLLLF